MQDDEQVPESLRTRRILYAKVLELKAAGVTIGAIGRELGILQDSVRYMIRNGPPKRVRRYEPDLSPSADLAYLAGFYIGDGRKGKREHKVGFYLADKEQLEYVGRLIARTLHRKAKPYYREGPFYVVDYDSVALSDFLNSPIPELLLYFKGYEADFVRGFFDAEGFASCLLNARSKTVTSVVVGVANTNKEYLKAVGQILAALGIDSTTRITNRQGSTMRVRGKIWTRRNTVLQLIVNGFDRARKFESRIGFHNRTKREKLNDLVGLQTMTPRGRYVWFTRHYGRQGRKWLKIIK